MLGFSIKLLTLSIVVASVYCQNLKDKVVIAVNCGGDNASGAYGIDYAADTLNVGTKSNFGMQFQFFNAPPEDLEIYQTEVWHNDDFQYSIPLKEDGDYVLMLKFSEVYFQHENKKVFDVSLNNHNIISNLDIFKESGGRGIAYDVYTPIQIKGKTLIIAGKPVPYMGNIELKFEKKEFDNPKVNGFAIIRGKLEDMPPLPPKHEEELNFEEFDIHDDGMEKEKIEGHEINDDYQGEVYDATTTDTNPFENEEDYTIIKIGVAILVIVTVAVIIRNYSETVEV